MYFIKKYVHPQIIVSDGGRNLKLNPEFLYEIDVQEFWNTESPDKYGGEFLKGFQLEHSVEYETWMLHIRNQIEKEYVKRLEREGKETLKLGKLREAEHYLSRCLEKDPFCESAAVCLMEVYQRQAKYHRAVGIYQKLKEELMEELGIAPLWETTQCYRAVLEEWNRKSKELNIIREDYIFARYEMFRQMEDFVLKKRNISTMVLLGEQGVGKTFLTVHFLKHADLRDYYVIMVSCYQSKTGNRLYPWQSVIASLKKYMSESGIELPLNYNMAISNLFSFEPCVEEIRNQMTENFGLEAVLVLLDVLREEKILIVFEDIHWMDSASLYLLNQTLHRTIGGRLIFLLTSRKQNPFIKEIEKDRLSKQWVIHPFTREETMQFIHQNGGKDFPAEVKEKLYDETSGNAFWLVQLIRSIQEQGGLPHTLQEIYTCRVQGLTEDEKLVLNLLSAFTEGVAIDVLLKISNKTPLELFYICQELCRRSLICQIQIGEKLILEFISPEQKDLVYKQIPQIRKRILHFRIAEAFVAVCNPAEPNLDARISYHYQKAGDYVNAFCYSMKSMERQIDLCYEVLPSDGIMDTLGNAETPVQALKLFERLMKDLNTARRNGLEEKKFLSMRMKILYEKSRFCCYKGLYEEALWIWDTLLNSEDTSLDIRIGVNRQMAYYGIQIYRRDVMETCIEDGLRLAGKYQNDKEITIFMRLKGLLLAWKGDFFKARIVLEESIRTSYRAFRLNAMERDMHIAYAYNYIGESYRLEGDLKNGVRAYRTAIEISEQNGPSPGLPVFYANYARMMLAEKNYSRMRSLLEKGLEYIKYVREPHGRALLLSLSAITAVWDHKEDKAQDYLKQARRCADALRGPQDIGYVFFVQAILQKEMEDRKKTPVFRERGEEYARKALQYLDSATSPYECRLLNICFPDEEEVIVSVFE